nr:hypothetical protein [Tanacetum cinerariifolium]
NPKELAAPSPEGIFILIPATKNYFNKLAPSVGPKSNLPKSHDDRSDTPEFQRRRGARQGIWHRDRKSGG